MSHETSLQFTHLHLHTVYSLLDGAIRIEDLMQQVKSLGMDAVAITDHGNMFGVIDFYLAAQKHGIKPIIGCEVYVAPQSRFSRAEVRKIADGANYHLVLLAKDKKGYKNLIKLCSRAYTEGYYYKPRIDYELLAQHSEGLVALTACLGGEVNRLLYEGDHEKARKLAGQLSEIMGKGNFYLEIQKHGLPEEEQVARGAYELSRRLGIPLVLTNDAHFLRREDQKAQEIMLRIQLNRKLNDKLEFSFNEEFYVKSPQEMALLYPELMDAIHNTQTIKEMCQLELELGHPLLPDFKTPAGQSLAEYLEELAKKGLQDRFEGREVPPLYQQRLEHELSVIHEMGFDGYFLIVWDFIRFAKERGIPVGPGRGSAAGSLVAYALGITSIDPLRYNLLFERFLNPQRKELPDIDIDFCRDRREEVIEYVTQKYGADHVSQIITFGTLSAKAVIKDVARVLDIEFSYINSLTKVIPNTPGIKLADTLEMSPELKDFVQKEEKGKLLYQVALALEGTPRNAGKHAAGVVISPQPLEEIIPLAKDTSTGSVITQFEKTALEKVGLVKMDFLGLKNLTIIENTLKEIRRSQAKSIDLEKIPLDDPKTFTLLQNGNTKGVFQVEGAGLTKLLREAKPTTFEDIVACLALYRPGPLESGMTESYVKRKNGLEKVSYPHPDLEPILKETFGTFVYQEQIMLVSQIMAGFTPAEADNLRKAMGKKQAQVMEKMRHKFIEQAVERGYDETLATSLFDDMSKFAEYGFNKSHSAAYGLITYWTAYLKANYPVEFMKASLDADIENTDKLVGLLRAAKDMGIEILPPDVQESEVFFSIVAPQKLRYGLLGIKGLGRGAAQAIVEARRGGAFQDITDLFLRLDPKLCHRKILESLVLSGACDRFGISRRTYIENADDILNFVSTKRRDDESGQISLFEDGQTGGRTFYLSPLPEWDVDTKLGHERETLGLYLSAHPLEKYQSIIKMSRLTPLSELDDGHSSERKVNVVGVIEDYRVTQNRKGSTVTLVKISDQSDIAEIRVSSVLYEKVRPLLEKGRIIVAEVRVTAFREEDPPLILLWAQNIDTIDSLRERAPKSLHIFLGKSPPHELSLLIPRLKSVLLRYRGDVLVYLYYSDGEGPSRMVQAHPQYSVTYCEDLEKALEEILPHDASFAWRLGDEIRQRKNGLVKPLST
ncbi:MAG: DNA polymerase III subunit alpha [Leptospiraceae bacterium]|nr:DNA polymerase III subunit alpha [Leptospiraceae bacterium]